MKDIERLLVRLDADSVMVLQRMVDDGRFCSLSEAVAVSVKGMIDSNFNADDVAEILRSGSAKDTVDIDLLLSNDDSDDIRNMVSKAVSDYVRSKMKLEE